MKLLALLAFAIIVVSNTPAFAATNACDYAQEWKGEVVRDYEAQDWKNARNWVPVTATLCKQADGKRYVIMGHKAPGLGLLRDVPAIALEPGEKPVDGVRYIALVPSYDEKEAHQILENKNVEGVIFFGESKTQVLGIRKQLGRIVSNTLFLKGSAE